MITDPCFKDIKIFLYLEKGNNGEDSGHEGGIARGPLEQVHS